MGTFEFWQRWLFVVTILFVAFGVAIALLNGTALFDTLFNQQIDPVFWDTATDENTQGFQRWVYGVLGAVMAGMGASWAFIAHYPFRRRERWAWSSLLVGITVWFVFDSFVSLRAKNYFNEFAINVPMLLAVLLPLWFTRDAFE